MRAHMRKQHQSPPKRFYSSAHTQAGFVHTSIRHPSVSAAVVGGSKTVQEQCLATRNAARKVEYKRVCGRTVAIQNVSLGGVHMRGEVAPNFRYTKLHIR